MTELVDKDVKKVVIIIHMFKKLEEERLNILGEQASSWAFPPLLYHSPNLDITCGTQKSYPLAPGTPVNTMC